MCTNSRYFKQSKELENNCKGWEYSLRVEHKFSIAPAEKNDTKKWRSENLKWHFL